ncbi:MAG TPA: hypothetical protein VMW42_08995 [Desulfatiglandales bacterium]|nr:hypothetical protein [Desulfatiglandales bacterium]
MKQLGTAIVCWVVIAIFFCWGRLDHPLAVYVAFMGTFLPLAPALLASSAIASRWALPWQLKGLCGAAISCLVVTTFLVATAGQIGSLFEIAAALSMFGLGGFLIGATATENAGRNVEQSAGE